MFVTAPVTTALPPPLSLTMFVFCPNFLSLYSCLWIFMLVEKNYLKQTDPSREKVLALNMLEF